MSGPVIFIMGPTASGKTGLALALAAHYPLEIVNADSMQIYRQLEIGTAKPTPAERAQAPHHLFDILEPNTSFSAGRYRQAALKVIAECHQRRTVPILVGGTGLYFRAVEQGIVDTPDIPTTIHDQLRSVAKKLGWPEMHKRLQAVDPAGAARLTPNDRQRILRALAVHTATGITLGDWQSNHHSAPAPFPILKLGCSCPRPELYRRIEERFDGMVASGLVAEVQSLLASGLNRELPAMKAVGYRQLFPYLDGEQSLEEAVVAAKVASRRYAKRQETWFKKESDLHFIDEQSQAKAEHLVTCFLAENTFSA